MAYYLAEEREVHFEYDPIEKSWNAWTNMPNWKNKLILCGWDLTKTGKVDGEEVDWTFVIHEQKPITVRNMNKARHNKNHAENAVSDEQDDSDDTFIDEE